MKLGHLQEKEGTGDQNKADSQRQGRMFSLMHGILKAKGRPTLEEEAGAKREEAIRKWM